MGWRKFLFDQLLIGADSKLSRQYAAEAVRYSPEMSSKLLSDALKHASTNVAFYRNSVPAADTCGLRSLPALTKQLLRHHHNELLADGVDPSTLDHITTSGSTGYPVRVLRDTFARESTRATEDYYFREFLGVEQADVPSVVFWANSPSIFGQKRDARKKFSLWLTRTSLLGASRITPEEMRHAIDTINTRKPVLIKAYTTTLFELARYIRENNIAIHRPRFIVSLAETLYDHVREYVEETFGCPIFDYYAAREVGPIAGQCKSGKMHRFEFHVHTEIVDENNQPVAPGAEGRVLVTQLRNRAMPLLRYDLEDTGISADTCSCGSALPVLQRIVGRFIDYFPAEDGTLVYGGYFNRLMFFEPWADEYAIVQKSQREIEFSYVAARPATDAEINSVQEKVRFTMGPNCKATFRRVDAIPRTESGKRSYSISEIRQRRTE
jgi:phenylacetate-CoA ligase